MDAGFRGTISVVLTAIFRAGRITGAPTTKAKSAAWKAVCRISIVTTAFPPTRLMRVWPATVADTETAVMDVADTTAVDAITTGTGITIAIATGTARTVIGNATGAETGIATVTAIAATGHKINGFQGQ